MKTVEDFIRWKYSKGKSLEETYAQQIKELEWDETDVLYSFLGIYTIGLLALYPDQFVSTSYQIRTKSGTKTINAYSNKFLRENWQNYQELNNLPELTEFLENYLSIGNLIPIWPGGNVHKGTISQCFDLPDVYFNKNRNKKMTKALINTYKNSYMDSIINSKNKDLSFYLEMDETVYKKFLKSIVGIIKCRSKKIGNILNQKELFLFG